MRPTSARCVSWPARSSRVIQSWAEPARVDSPDGGRKQSPMKLRTLRRVLARSFWVCTCVPAVAAAILFLVWEPLYPALLLDPSYTFSLLMFFIAIGGAAFLAGALSLWPIAFTLVNRFNGAPFEVGDVVCILVGPNRDRTVRVYSVWSERGQVRVELGETEKATFKDVFGYVEVCRTS
jgi:hypothetical protein